MGFFCTAIDGLVRSRRDADAGTHALLLDNGFSARANINTAVCNVLATSANGAPCACATMTEIQPLAIRPHAPSEVCVLRVWSVALLWR